MIERELRDHVIAHPLQAVAIAVLVGAVFGIMATPRGKIGEIFGATIGAVALRLLRDTAVREVTSSARRRWRADQAS